MPKTRPWKASTATEIVAKANRGARQDLVKVVKELKEAARPTPIASNGELDW